MSLFSRLFGGGQILQRVIPTVPPMSRTNSPAEDSSPRVVNPDAGRDADDELTLDVDYDTATPESILVAADAVRSPGDWFYIGPLAQGRRLLGIKLLTFEKPLGADRAEYEVGRRGFDLLSGQAAEYFRARYPKEDGDLPQIVFLGSSWRDRYGGRFYACVSHSGGSRYVDLVQYEECLDIPWRLAVVRKSPAAGGPEEEMPVTECRLGPAPLAGQAYEVTRSRDQLHMAWARRIPNGKWSVVVDGQSGAGYDGIAEGTILFSPDGKRIAYNAQQGGGRVVVLDGSPGPKIEATVAILFSPDGGRLAYVACRGRRRFVVVDGRPGPEYDTVAKTLYFSPDSTRLAYVAWRGGKPVVVADGRPGPEFDSIGEGGIEFSLKGEHVAYTARKGDKWFAVVDGQSGPKYDGIADLSIAGSGKVAYAATKDNGWFVVADGQEEGEYDGIGDGPIFSPDGRRLAYQARRGNRYFVVVGGQPGPECDGLAGNTLVFSPDSRRVGYAALKGGRWSVVVDGRTGNGFDGIGGPVFSSDGKRFAYGARQGSKWFTVVDGQAGPEFDVIAKGDPIFSSDGSRFAYAARKDGKWFVVVDGQEWPAYDVVPAGPFFSSDGKRIACSAEKDGRRFVVVDGLPGPEYDGISGGPTFTPNGVEYLAVRDGWLLRCR